MRYSNYHRVDVLEKALALRKLLGRELTIGDIEKAKKADEKTISLYHIYKNFKGGLTELNKVLNEILNEETKTPEQSCFDF